MIIPKFVFFFNDTATTEIYTLSLHDALPISTEPGTWGQEVPWGGGQVGTDLFLETLKEVDYDGVLSIEREQGDDPLGDIAKAVAQLVG